MHINYMRFGPDQLKRKVRKQGEKLRKNSKRWRTEGNHTVKMKRLICMIARKKKLNSF